MCETHTHTQTHTLQVSSTQCMGYSGILRRMGLNGERVRQPTTLNMQWPSCSTPPTSSYRKVLCVCVCVFYMNDFI